jgi:hypothetical protein
MSAQSEKIENEISNTAVTAIGGEAGQSQESCVIPCMMAVAEKPERPSRKKRSAQEKEKQAKEFDPVTKKIGEISEAAFLFRSVSMGFGAAKPWGDSERFDCIVWSGNGPLLRVQVKCTISLHHRGYAVQPTCNSAGVGKVEYTAEDFDFLAAHIQSLDIWYLLPSSVFAPAAFLKFYPDIKARDPLREGYRDAWTLLRNWRQIKPKHGRQPRNLKASR